MLYERMLLEKHLVDEKIRETKEKMKHAPEGKLLCAKNGKHVKWYRSDGHQKKYIPKADLHLAEQLAIKKYLSVQLENLLRKQKAITQFLKYYDSRENPVERLLTDTSEYARLLAPFYTSLNQELTTWMNTPYKHNDKYPEQLVHRTSSGIMVRSKSEAIIASQLYEYHVPFLYECELKLGDFIMYPDFTIRHPRNGEYYYWEHFGMINDSEYSKNAFSKMQFYTINGIYPSIRLLTTYETKEHPLDIKVVKNMISQHFL